MLSKATCSSERFALSFRHVQANWLLLKDYSTNDNLNWYPTKISFWVPIDCFSVKFFPGEVVAKCIFEIVVGPNVSMVNSKSVQTKNLDENLTLSQFVIFIGTVIYIKWYRGHSLVIQTEWTWEHDFDFSTRISNRKSLKGWILNMARKLHEMHLF